MGAVDDLAHPEPATGLIRKGDLPWPPDPRERSDFYHRTRAFPDDVRVWRKRFVGRVMREHGVFPLVPRNARPEEVRALVDDGIAYLREIARILALLYGTPRSASRATSGVDAGRVLARLGLYRELGFSCATLDHARLQAVLSELVPPNLRDSLDATLELHAQKVCEQAGPQCNRCEIRNFCSTYRTAGAAASVRSNAPTVVDLFAGAGGLSEGFTRAGFRVVLALDQDPAARRTYWLNHPALPDDRLLTRDVRDLKPGELRKLVGRRPLDVLVGAPPCQGFSHAGFRSKRTRTGYRVTADERNFLFEYMVAAALELRPKLFLMENVPGMHSARHENLSFLEVAARVSSRRGATGQRSGDSTHRRSAFPRTGSATSSWHRDFGHCRTRPARNTRTFTGRISTSMRSRR